MSNEERFEEILRKVLGSQDETKTPVSEKEKMMDTAQLFYDAYSCFVTVGFNEEQAPDILLTMVANSIQGGNV